MTNGNSTGTLTLVLGPPLVDKAIWPLALMFASVRVGVDSTLMLKALSLLLEIYKP